MHVLRTRLLSFLLGATSCLSLPAHADPVPARYPQGSSHAFLSVKTLEGKWVATGELTVNIKGDRVTSRVIFHFRDGSVDDDLTVFTQRGVFRLISDHHVQRGPVFPKPIDFLIDAVTGQVTARMPDGTVTQEHMDLPEDLANGLPPNLLLSILPSTPETKVSYVAPGAKPRLVRLSIKPTGVSPFTVGGMRKKATDYTVHVELGGLTGVIAPMIGKEPADYHIWIADGAPPAFVREEGPFYLGGPVWRMEVISPKLSH